MVIGVDGSANGERAVRWAAREAGERQMRIRLVAVVDEPGEAMGQPAWVSPTALRDPFIETARRHIRVATDSVHYIAENVEVDADVRVGHPVGVLLDESGRAGLLVVGHRGLGGVTGLLAGSVAVGVAARAGCPVVVVRGSTGERDAHPEGPVVVGVDGSRLSEAAVEFAFDAASRRGVGLVAVHAWLDRIVAAGKAAGVIDWDAVRGEEAALLAQRLAGWAEKYPDVTVNPIVLADRPARALVNQSENAQLVVVGSHGRGAIIGAALGSVSQALIHRAACPVAVIRTGAA
jgi:nucleotide-binding universal stress UspA family protein